MTLSLGLALGYALLIWLAALAVIIAFRILLGQISLGGLLATEGAQIDPERLQSLVVTLFVVGMFVVEGTRSAGSHAFPQIPQSLLILLTGSNGLYLSGKMVRIHTRGQQRPRRRARPRHKPRTSRPASPSRTSRPRQGG